MMSVIIYEEYAMMMPLATANFSNAATGTTATKANPEIGYTQNSGRTTDRHAGWVTRQGWDGAHHQQSWQLPEPREKAITHSLGILAVAR